MRTVGMGVIPKDAALKQENATLKAENTQLKSENETGDRRSEIQEGPQKDQGRRSGSRRRVEKEGAVCLT